MIQRRDHLGFPLEASQPVGVGRERLEHLERHVPVERGVAGLPDFTHAAFADEGNDFVDTELAAGFEAHDLGVLRGKRHTVAFPYHLAGAEDRLAKCKAEPPA